MFENSERNLSARGNISRLVQCLREKQTEHARVDIQ